MLGPLLRGKIQPLQCHGGRHRRLRSFMRSHAPHFQSKENALGTVLYNGLDPIGRPMEKIRREREVLVVALRAVSVEGLEDRRKIPVVNAAVAIVQDLIRHSDRRGHVGGVFATPVQRRHPEFFPQRLHHAGPPKRLPCEHIGFSGQGFMRQSVNRLIDGGLIFRDRHEGGAGKLSLCRNGLCFTIQPADFERQFLNPTPIG